MQNLQNGLYQRDARFYCDFYESDGTRVRQSLKTSNLKTAIERLQELRGEDISSSLMEVPNAFSVLTESYLKRLEVYGKESSLREARYICKRLKSHFGSRPITQDCLTNFISLRRKEGVKDRTINSNLAILRAVLNNAVEAELLKSVPVKIKMLKFNRKRSMRLLSKDEIEKLIDYAEEPHKGILLVAASTGFRAAEILNLTWDDLDAENGILSITGKNGWSPKSHQERSSFISSRLVQYLQNRRESVKYTEDEDYIFSTRTRHALSVTNADRKIKEIFEKVGLYRKGEPLLHRIRHTVASHLVKNGISLEVVRIQLGHADLHTTALYVSALDSEKKQVAEMGVL